MASPHKAKNAKDLPSPFEMEEKAAQMYKQWQPYFKPAGIIILVVLVLAIGTTMKDEGTRSTNAEAHELIHEAHGLATGPDAPTVAVLEQQRGHYNKVVKEYADTPGAVDAAFYLARVELDAGNGAGAEAAFKAFLGKYPDASPFSTMAKLGIANALMAQGKYADAQAEYLKVAKDEGAKLEAEFACMRAQYQAGMAAILTGDGTAADKILNDLRIDVETREKVKGEDNRFTTLKDDAEDLLAKMKIYSAKALQEFVVAPIPDPPPPVVPGAEVETQVDPTQRSQGPPAPPVTESPTPVPEAPEAAPPATETPEAATPAPGTPESAAPAAESATPPAPVTPAPTPAAESAPQN